MREDAPTFENRFGNPAGGIDMLPKPVAGKLPLLITGASQQDPDWIAEHGDGWMTYPRNVPVQAKIIKDWRSRIQAAGGPSKPAMQSLYVDLTDNPETPPRPIHLGFRLGMRHLRAYLEALAEIGINHVAINLRLNHVHVERTMKQLADELLPQFPG